MFISTIVVGSIALLCPCVLPKTILYRDLPFFLLAVTALLIIAIARCVPFWLAISYFVMYLVYVSIVLIYSWFGEGQDGSVDRAMINSIAGDIGLTRFDAESIQTAFWHRDAAGEQVTPTPAATKGKSVPFRPPPATNTHNQAQPSGGYSFLILSSEEDGEEKNDNQRDLENGVINISGGFEPDFSAIIKEDFYTIENAGTIRAGEAGRSLASTGYSVREETEEEEEGTDNDISSEATSLEDRLLPSGGSGSGRAFLLGNDEFDGGRRARQRRARVRSIAENNPLLTSLYWQQWSLQRQFQRSALATEWHTYPWYQKVLSVLEYPWVVMRELTIPTLDPANWSKFHAVMHPIVDPLFITFFLGLSQGSVEGVPVVVICLLVSVVPAAVIFLFTLRSRPPTSPAFTFCWTISAFVMCVMWIYILASELITCLSALGTISHIPPAFLGLTVLAWGNSLGDYFTNIGVAKGGHGEMALAGCYGGPVFNILGGMSVGLSIASYQTFPEPYPLKLDAACIMSIVFLYVSLISTIVIVTMNNYKVDRTFGIYLITLYAVYSICQFTLLWLG